MLNVVSNPSRLHAAASTVATWGGSTRTLCLVAILALGACAAAPRDRASTRPWEGDATELPDPLRRSSSGAQDDPQDDTTDQDQEGSFWDKFIDPEDGHFDVIQNRESVSGVLPLVIPINDPAVGFGLIAGAAYFHPRKDSAPDESGRFSPPSITFAGGGYTENGTKAAALGHMGVWNEGRTRYLGAVIAGSVNLDFYGIGEDPILSGSSVPFNLEAFGTIQQVEFQLGDTDFFLGTRYVFGSTVSTFDDPSVIPSAESESDNAGLGAFVSYDSRDNIFTPSSGTNAELRATYFSEALGGDFEYSNASLYGLHYQPIKETTVLGLRLEGQAVGDGAPYYALPYVKLRGVPAFRYLGRYVVVGEVEPRWILTPRWQVVAFGGLGKAAATADRLSEVDLVYSLGAGFRYVMARKLGLAAGLDIARGPEESALYFTIGSAWARP